MSTDDFAELLDQVLDPDFRLAMTMLNERSAAENAVQEAAWRKRDRFRRGAPMRPWFLAIVANECRSARRARWWRIVRLPEVSPARESTGTEERMDPEAALHRLPHQHLLVLSLYYHLDLPIDEVARVLDCSEGAARQRLHRALVALRPTMAIEADA